MLDVECEIVACGFAYLAMDEIDVSNALATCVHGATESVGEDALGPCQEGERWARHTYVILSLPPLVRKVDGVPVYQGPAVSGHYASCRRGKAV